MRRSGFVLLLLAVLAALLTPASAPAAPSPPPTERLEVYVGTVAAADLAELTALGIDRRELVLKAVADGEGKAGSVRVEVILTTEQARRLGDRGIDLSVKEIDGQTVRERSNEMLAKGTNVFRPYSGAGGLAEELRTVARQHPEIAELVRFGTTLKGKPMLGLRVTKGVGQVEPGSRPAVLYLGAQHAREWITPEMVRRLMHHIVDGYAGDPELRRLVNRTELWFIPVLNPDGYDYSFTPDNRLWRKNLRDNNGNGIIDGEDGVDLNRNSPYKWGYDNEGSSPVPSSQTYRGASPASEPETQAIGRLTARVGFEFVINYHSAAELLLYGVGWQVATPAPDDVIYEAMAGDDERPAVPGYDPDISAELYITNGDLDSDLGNRFGVLGFTPEMSTCEVASASDPDDEWLPEDCGSGFEFPDDEELISAEVLKNFPFALAVARSAHDPDDPESVVGRNTPHFQVDTFDVSYGDPQTVAVVAKRALRDLTLRYRIGDGPVRTAPAREWRGGERYGDENDKYYAEFRGVVRGAAKGDRVRAWFTAVKPGKGTVSSSAFRYEVRSDTGDRVLVIANEDYTGVNPDYPESVTAPKYAREHLALIRRAGFSADLWDVDRQGVPHDLGVLSHYDAVVWYLGDNRLTQDPEDELTSTPLGDLPDLSVAERQQYLTMSVRDFLNEGGKLVHAGETVQHQGLEGISDIVGGLYYGLNGDPSAECVIAPRPGGDLSGLFEDCLLLANDFRQYYLGGYGRTSTEAAAVDGVAPPFTGFAGTLGGGTATPDNPVDEAGVFEVTSDVLPVSEFPQFASRGSMVYPLAASSPYAPIEGERYAGALHVDDSYMRLTRTATIPAGSTQASLAFQLSADTEEAYDHVIVEARTAGGDDWTTLPEAGGLSRTDPPAECEVGFLLDLHPFLEHYLGGADCTAPGTTGTWNSITGSTGGWQDVSYDLTSYAGSEVELSITYVTDPGSGGVGVFVDDTRLMVDGAVVDEDGFEGATSLWTPSAAPEGSPSFGGTWEISGNLLIPYAAVSTRDTHLLGFGVEQLATDAQRREAMRRALRDLIG